MKIPSKLSKYISGGAAKNITPADQANLEAKDVAISFILVQIKDDDLTELEHLITSVCDTLMRRDFMVSSVVSSLVVATVGFPMKEAENPDQKCQQVAGDLTTNHRGKLKVLYGSLPGKFGIFGHPKIKKFGPVLPGFGALLNQVTDLEYGEARQRS